ncbi:MAG: SEC-C domain-containing protein [Solirubrobacterales bacterium]
MSVSRNSPCPCGSGLKYKRCCLAVAERAKQGSRLDDEVGQRIQDWASRELSDEIGAALEQFAGRERVMTDTDVQLFTTWFHNDRELRCGGTPAERYAARSELPVDERAIASRIAAACLRIHRVLAVEPGVSLLLEDVVGGGRVEVRSENVSRDAVRWDMLIGRVMDGDPPTLWGPARLLEPADEPGLIAELERLAGGSVSSMGDRAAHVFRAHALELMRYRPPRWDVEPSFFTVEGDPIVQSSATWSVRDLREVRERFRVLGRLAPHDPLEMDITAPRDRLVAERPQLPDGAIVIEASAGDLDTVSVATLRLEGEHLSVEAMSEEWLDHAIDIVASDFDQLVELSHREVLPIEPLLAEHRQAPSRASKRSSSVLPPAEERHIVAGFMTERMRRWLDEPHPQLGGCTPRHAAAGEHRADLVILVRGIENTSDRARRGGEPFADIAWIRDELGLDELAA